MSYRPRYEKGDWKAVCDVCGREFKATRLRKRWDGFMVCNEDYETRHPQDFVRGKTDTQVPAWTRPETPDVFTTGIQTQEGKSSYAGYAIAGYAITGNGFPTWFSSVPPSTFTP